MWSVIPAHVLRRCLLPARPVRDWVATVVLTAGASGAVTLAGAPPEEVLVILEEQCFSCHEDGTEKGDVRLDNLGELALEPRLDLLNRMHEKIHFNEKAYACRFCGKAFVQKNNMEAHERIHTGEKPYSCKFCGEAFVQGTRRNQHQNTCKSKTCSPAD